MIINFIQPNANSAGIQTADGFMSSDDLLKYYSVDGISRWRGMSYCNISQYSTSLPISNLTISFFCIGIGVLLGWTVFYRIIFYVVLVRSFNGQRKA